MKHEPRLNVPHLFSGAREAFQRRPGLCMAMFLLFSIFSGNGGGGNGQDNSSMPLWIGISWGLVGLGIFLCSGAIRGGYDMAMLRLHRGDDSLVFRDVFAGFKKFWRLFGTVLFLVLIVIGAALVPLLSAVLLASMLDIWTNALLWAAFGGTGLALAFTACLGLWPSFLLLMDEDLRPTETIRRAWNLTAGYKTTLLWLSLTCLLLWILVAAAAGCVFLMFSFGVASILTAGAVGIGLALFVGPLTQLAWIGAYRELRGSTDPG